MSDAIEQAEATLDAASIASQAAYMAFRANPTRPNEQACRDTEEARMDALNALSAAQRAHVSAPTMTDAEFDAGTRGLAGILSQDRES